MRFLSLTSRRLLARSRAIALVAAAVAGFLAVVLAASAHSRPVRFDPAPGAVLSSAPAEVHGWFTSELRLDPNWTYLHVTDAQGNRVDSGDTKLSSDRLQASVALKSGLGDGAYTVEYRTFDDQDGAVLGDCYTFFVGQAAADAAVAARTRLDGGQNCNRIDLETGGATPTAAQVATAVAPEPEATGSGGGSGSGDVPVWGLIAGIIAGVVVGGVAVSLVGRRGRVTGNK